MKDSFYKIKKKVFYYFKTLLASLNITKVKLSESEDKWLKEAQTFEFDFHKNNAFRQSSAFMEETQLLFSSFGFLPNQFDGKIVVDLGAGSRMRGKYFTSAHHYIIEPMAEKCMSEIPWCDFKDAVKVYSVPAEKFIVELQGKVDFLFSINVLDHCFNFEQIIKNIDGYLAPDGLAFLSFDSHFETSKGHPLILTDRSCRQVFKRAGLKVIKASKQFPKPYKDVYSKTGYDNSSDCLNYWLVKIGK